MSEDDSAIDEETAAEAKLLAAAVAAEEAEGEDSTADEAEADESGGDEAEDQDVSARTLRVRAESQEVAQQLGRTERSPVRSRSRQKTPLKRWLIRSVA